MTDLEACAQLLGEQYAAVEGVCGQIIIGSGNRQLSGWSLAGALLEKLAETWGHWPEVKHVAYLHGTKTWRCQIEGRGNEHYAETAPAAIISCAATVYRQAQLIPETDLQVKADER